MNALSTSDWTQIATTAAMAVVTIWSTIKLVSVQSVKSNPRIISTKFTFLRIVRMYSLQVSITLLAMSFLGGTLFLPVSALSIISSCILSILISINACSILVSEMVLSSIDKTIEFSTKHFQLNNLPKH